MRQTDNKRTYSRGRKTQARVRIKTTLSRNKRKAGLRKAVVARTRRSRR